MATITIPDGVNSLRFGGVDATAFFGTDQSQAPGNNGQSDQFDINLGLNTQGGTRIVVDQMISNGQAATSATASPTQDTIIVRVAGRISLFEANSIMGNSTVAPTRGSLVGGTVIGSTSNSLLAGKITLIGARKSPPFAAYPLAFSQSHRILAHP